MRSTWELEHVTYVKVHVRARLELPPSPDRAKMMGELGSSLAQACHVSFLLPGDFTTPRKLLVIYIKTEL